MWLAGRAGREAVGEGPIQEKDMLFGTPPHCGKMFADFTRKIWFYFDLMGQNAVFRVKRLRFWGTCPGPSAKACLFFLEVRNFLSCD